jgi:hypothetical protein
MVVMGTSRTPGQALRLQSRLQLRLSPQSPFPVAEAVSDEHILRTGFFITMKERDTTVDAYLSNVLVGGSDTFDSVRTGSFAGIKFTTGFDRIVIDRWTSSELFACWMISGLKRGP